MIAESELYPLRDEVAKKVLLDPRISIGNAELLLCVDVEVIGAIFVEYGVLSVEYFVPTSHIGRFESPKVSSQKGELLSLGIVDDLFDVPFHVGKMLGHSFTQIDR